MASLGNHLTLGILCFCLFGTIIIDGLSCLPNICIIFDRDCGDPDSGFQVFRQALRPSSVHPSPFLCSLWSHGHTLQFLRPSTCILHMDSLSGWHSMMRLHLKHLFSTLPMLLSPFTKKLLRFEFISSQVSKSKPNLPGSRFIFTYNIFPTSPLLSLFWINCCYIKLPPSFYWGSYPFTTFIWIITEKFIFLIKIIGFLNCSFI